MKCPECKGTGKIELFTSTVDCTECVNGNVPQHDFVVPQSEREPARGGYIEPKRNWVPDEEIVFHRGGYPDSAQYDAAPVKICTTKPHGIPIPHGIHPTFIDTLERRVQQYGSAIQQEDRVHRMNTRVSIEEARKAQEAGWWKWANWMSQRYKTAENQE